MEKERVNTESAHGMSFIALQHEFQNIGANAGAYRLPSAVQKARLQKVIRERLTPIQREILMEYMTGVTQTEIAARRGCSPSTISRTLKRAVRRCRDYLSF